MSGLPIRAVVFDLDDTLVDHEFAIREAVTELYRSRPELAAKFSGELVFQSSWVAAQDRFYPSHRRGELSHAQQKVLRIRELWRGIAELSEEDCFQIYDQFQLFYAQKWKLFPDVLPCLSHLRPLKLGLVTNGFQNQRKKLAVENLYEKFSVVIISSEVGLAKPDPRIFRMACAALSVQPAEAIYVGDLYDLDVKGAQGAGMVPVWLRRRAEHLESPGVLTIRSLNELAALLKEYNRKT